MVPTKYCPILRTNYCVGSYQTTYNYENKPQCWFLLYHNTFYYEDKTIVMVPTKQLLNMWTNHCDGSYHTTSKQENKPL